MGGKASRVRMYKGYKIRPTQRTEMQKCNYLWYVDVEAEEAYKCCTHEREYFSTIEEAKLYCDKLAFHRDRRKVA